MRTLAVLACLLALAAPAGAERWDDGAAGHRRKVHLAVTLSLGTLYLSSTTFLKKTISPDQCRWCEPPSFDVSVRRALVWDDARRARTLSDLTGYLAAPVLAFGLSMAPLLTNDGRVRGGDVIDVTLPILESVVVSQSLSQLAKTAFGRQRPYAHFDGLPAAGTQDDNMSFFSGHAALAFSLITSAGLVAHQRGSRTEPFIWGIGLPLATATAYLRMAGDKHYLSDVLVGSLVGAAAGLTVPRFFARDLSLVPTERGAALAGRF